VLAEGGRRAIGFRGERLKTKTISRYNKFSKKTAVLRFEK